MRRIAALSLLMLLGGPAAWAGDFVDTRLNFTMTHENMLVRPGETNPSVPGFRIGQPNRLGIMFFDNYDTRYTGYENLTHLVISKVMNTSRVTAEGAYVLRLLQFTDVNLSSIDDGSYIRIAYWFDKSRVNKTNISLTAFPLSADRMRLGFSYRLTWGGSPIFYKFNPDIPTDRNGGFASNTRPAPGAKLQISGERYYVYFGFKSSEVLNRNPAVNDNVAVYGVMAGFGVDLWKEHIRLEGAGGYFDRGTNPLFYGTTVGPQGMTFTDFPVATYGGVLQLAFFDGLSPTTSLDLRLYRNDPLVSAQRYFSRPEYSPRFVWMVATEFSALGTTLQDPDSPNSTRTQFAFAGDLNLRMQKGKTRIKADFATRSLGFILLNQPSLPPFQDFPNGADVRPEFFADIGADYFIERIGMTVGGTVGVLQPATYTPPLGQTVPIAPGTGGTTAVSTTLVVRNEGDISILPEGQREVPIMAAKLEVREDFLEWFAAIVQLYYSYDANYTNIGTAPDGTALRQFIFPHRLGINITLQARY